jgi:hypothetical protein
MSLFCRNDGCGCVRDNDLAGALGATLQPPIFDRDSATLDPAELAQPLHKGRDPWPPGRRREPTQEPDGWYLRRPLRARQHRPHPGSAETRDESPPLHRPSPRLGNSLAWCTAAGEAIAVVDVPGPRHVLGAQRDCADPLNHGRNPPVSSLSVVAIWGLTADLRRRPRSLSCRTVVFCDWRHVILARRGSHETLRVHSLLTAATIAWPPAARGRSLSSGNRTRP